MEFCKEIEERCWRATLYVLGGSLQKSGNEQAFENRPFSSLHSTHIWIAPCSWRVK